MNSLIDIIVRLSNWFLSDNKGYALIVLLWGSLIIILMTIRKLTTSEYVQTGQELILRYRQEVQDYKDRQDALEKKVFELECSFLKQQNSIHIEIIACELKQHIKCPIRNILNEKNNGK